MMDKQEYARTAIRKIECYQMKHIYPGERLLCIDRKFTGIFCKDPDVISVACQIIHITFPFYFIYSIMELTGSVVRGLKKTFLSMVAMVYPMTWLLAMFSFLLCYRKSELFRSF